jgi:hypothetical protein
MIPLAQPILAEMASYLELEIPAKKKKIINNRVNFISLPAT